MSAPLKRPLVILALVSTAFFIATPFTKCIALDDEGDIKGINAINSNKNESAFDYSKDGCQYMCGACGKISAVHADACPECGWPSGGLPPSPAFAQPSFEILESDTRSVEVTFKGVIILDGGDPEKADSKHWLFMVQWGNSGKIEQIPLGNVFHGYRFCKIEKKGNAGEENWRLTIEHTDGKIFTLGLNTITLLYENYIIIRPDIDDESAVHFEAYEGDSFVSKDRIYRIQDISGERILINDIAGFAFIVKMSL